jgi:hypothetical protein
MCCHFFETNNTIHSRGHCRLLLWHSTLEYPAWTPFVFLVATLFIFVPVFQHNFYLFLSYFSHFLFHFFIHFFYFIKEEITFMRPPCCMFLWIIYLSIYLSIYLPTYLPVCLSVYLFIHPSIHPFNQSLFLSVCLFASLSIHLGVSLCLLTFRNTSYLHVRRVLRNLARTLYNWKPPKRTLREILCSQRGDEEVYCFM